MSVQVVIDFIAKVEQDPALADTVGKVESGNLEQLCEVARNAGFEFSVQDWKRTVTRPEAGELNDDQLSQVSGGVDALKRQTKTPTKQIPKTLKRFGATITDPNSLVKGLDWEIGRLDV
jgi:predicted ribosomally synthesized peptide with nif11-like leader